MVVEILADWSAFNGHFWTQRQLEVSSYWLDDHTLKCQISIDRIKNDTKFQTNPISPAGEVLKFPVGQANEDDPDYSELLSDEDWTFERVWR